MTPKDGTQWHGLVAARSLLSFSRYGTRSGRAQGRALGTGAELFRSDSGHYDVDEGGATFADVLRTEVDFLHRQAKSATHKVS